MVNGVFRLKAVLIVVGALTLTDSSRPSALGQTQSDVAEKFAKNKQFTFGKDTHGNVVYLHMVRVTDEQVESVDANVLSDLRMLIIQSDKITNRSLRHLCKLPSSLWFLSIHDAPIDDKAMLPLLKTQTFLRDICLDGTNIGDRTLSALEGFNDLGVLSLKRVKVTDVGINSVATIPILTSLDLAGTDITDSALRSLKRKILLRLGLRGTKITDAGLQELAGQEYLKYLDVRDTRVSDAGILRLGSCASLEEIHTARTKVTDAGAAALRKVLPNLEVK